MVLADDNFATIVEAVGEGRTVFDNLKKVILFLLSCNMSEVLVVFIMAFIAPEMALLPLQLLWINLVTDGPPALALGVDPPEPGVLDRKPRDVNEPILNSRRLGDIGLQGAVMTVAALGVSWVGASYLGADDLVVRTMLFTVLVLVQKLHAFNFAAGNGGLFSGAVLRNKWLVLAFFGTMLVQVLVVYLPAAQTVFETAPLTAAQWGVIALGAVVSALVMDLAGGLRKRADG